MFLKYLVVKTIIVGIYIIYIYLNAYIGGVWRSGLCVGVLIRGSQVQTPLQSACRCVPGQDTSPQIAPVGIAHSIEYVSRFG